ncbi:MAG: hypothetical protein KZQ92_14820, partial [Candidatus Thiodiazotropha sp. (ex Lucinoma borealis)]|nr:hypothetical protein [Candidatus Thiodiazotropha sp. (ex Lucinoma borealis)]
RTSKTEGSVTTSYVVDENRDYAQVLIEDDGTAQVSYTYGDDLISQTRGGATSFYHYDGLGSTRSLTDSLGNLANTYDYEAFGEVLNQTGSVENGYLFAGEQFDPTLDQYYLRARYYDPSQGRFTQQDTWMGNNQDPITLHKYLYANADPGNMVDPTGNFSLGSFGTAMNVLGRLTTIATTTYDVFQIATGEKEFSARELGTAALLSRLPTKFVKHLLIKACKANSFDGDTLVSSEDGLIPISEVKIGDFVWAYDELTGGLSLQKVVHLIVGEGDKALVKITLINSEEVLATSEHPFYLPSVKVWIVASELKKGDDLLDVSGQSIKITNVEAYQKVTKVYNLTVDKEHTYFVGESGVLNHNSSCFKLNSRIKENPRLVKAAEKAGKNQKAQKDIDDLTRKLSEGNLNPGKGTKPVGKGVSEARGEHGGRVYFRVIKGEIEILGKSDKANQPEVIKEILKTFK